MQNLQKLNGIRCFVMQKKVMFSLHKQIYKRREVMLPTEHFCCATSCFVMFCSRTGMFCLTTKLNAHQQNKAENILCFVGSHLCFVEKIFVLFQKDMFCSKKTSNFCGVDLTFVAQCQDFCRCTIRSMRYSE